MYDNKTVFGKTITTEGAIPHLRHPDGFYMPVKLNIVNNKNKMIAYIYGEHPPMKDKMGNLIYALPGGGEYISELVC